MSLPRLFWRQSHDLVRQTLQIPFLQKLYDGSIQENHLDEYLRQDRYFQHIVRPYRRSIKQQTSINEYSPNSGTEILQVQIESTKNLKIIPSQETMRYIEYFFANSYSLPTAIASLLPCSKLYRFLTSYLSCLNPSDQCRSWIESETYPSYQDNTNRLEYLINLYGGENIDELSTIYRKGLEHENSFFSQFDGIKCK